MSTPSSPDSFDLVVIGAGPGGYVAAIRAAQLGMRTACVEKDGSLGGTCLNVGCIPSKALLESSERLLAARHHMAEHGIKVQGVELDLPTMMARKNRIVGQLTGGISGLFRKRGVTSVRGLGRIAGPGRVEVVGDTGTRVLETRNILIATGSTPSTIPGVELDGDRIGTSTEALAYPEVPAHLIVIGAGVIGLELGSVWARLGSRVTLLEYLPTLLPMMDEDIGKLAARLFVRQGLEMLMGVKVTGTTRQGDRVTVDYVGADGQKTSMTGDRVLVSVGRRPNTTGLGAEAAGLKLDKRGCITVDSHYFTGVPGIYAIGDVITGPMLAHKAEEEGIAAVEHMAGQPGHVNYDAIPNVIYTHPEIAAVGKTEAELKQAGIPYRKGSFPFVANGRAKALGDTDGFVKILAHAETDRILGVHIIGPRASDMIAEAAVAVEFSASAEDLARSVHAHPTLAEVMKEAALDAGGRVIHF
jgi:dihydrolipoamide dehydrogenase